MKAFTFAGTRVQAAEKCMAEYPDEVDAYAYFYWKSGGLFMLSNGYQFQNNYLYTYLNSEPLPTYVYFNTTEVIWCENGDEPNLALPLEQQCPDPIPDDPLPLQGKTLGKPQWCAGNPIDIGSGNKFQSETDHASTAASGIALQRYYNSRDTSSGALGTGWRHGYERRLYIGDSIRAVRADGRIYTFTSTGSAWASDPDVTDRLAAIASGWSYTTPDGTVEHYDSQGRLLSVTDRTGRSQTLNYNAAGQLSQVTDAYGRSLEFGYAADGRLVTVQAPAGASYAYQYSGGRLSRATYPDGSQRNYRYDDASHPGALTTILDGSGNLIAGWSYDAQGRAISSTHADGADNTQVAYNADGSVTVTNALGKQTTYHFATYHDVPQVVQVVGHATASCAGANQAYSYDANGFLLAKTDWNGITTTYTRDSQGRELSRTEAVGTPEARTISTTWHAQWNLPLTITEPGRVTSFSYDANGQLLSRSETPAP